jgi:hypothetical protein
MEKVNSLLTTRLNHHGLGWSVIAGQICREAERLYPNIFQTISVRQSESNVTLHIQVPNEKLISFRLIEGGLLRALQTFCVQQKYPVVTKIRLTIESFSDRI